MSGLNAADLDREITLQRVSRDLSASGDPIETWTNYAVDVPATWRPGGTTETWRAQQRLGSFIDGVYRIRSMVPIPTPDEWRVIGHDGRTYDLKGCIEDAAYDRDEAFLLSVIAHGEADA